MLLVSLPCGTRRRREVWTTAHHVDNEGCDGENENEGAKAPAPTKRKCTQAGENCYRVVVNVRALMCGM